MSSCWREELKLKWREEATRERTILGRVNSTEPVPSSKLKKRFVGLKNWKKTGCRRIKWGGKKNKIRLRSKCTGNLNIQ